MRFRYGFLFRSVGVAVALLTVSGSWLKAAEGDVPPPAAGSYGPQSDEEKADALLIRQEDDRDKQKVGEIQLTSLEGRLYLTQEINEHALPWVIGRFAVQGRAYLLVMDSADVFNSLKSLDGKTTKLSGRIRLGGKYFVTTSIFVSLNIPSSPPKRGGM